MCKIGQNNFQQEEILAWSIFFKVTINKKTETDRKKDPPQELVKN